MPRTKWPSKNLIVVLVGPEEPGNIGAVARAMKNMGLHRLYLVSPCRFDSPEAIRMAHRSGEILKRAKVFETVDSALSEAATVVGFTARRRRTGSVHESIDRLAPEILARALRQPVALLFGPEGGGLSNEDLSRCHRVVSIPTGGRFSSLNLAQAVLAAAYTLRLAAYGRTEKTARSLASSGEMERLQRHLEGVLSRIGFLKGPAGTAMMRDLRRISLRAGLDAREVRIFRGILRQAEWAIRKAGGAPLKIIPPTLPK
jgi:TrmH family RNA methyltransferase